MSIIPFILPTNVSQALNIGSGLLAYLNSPSLNGVKLDVEKYEETAQAEMSSILLLDVNSQTGLGRKQFITDNLAPHPRTWNLSGYISDPTEFLGAIDARIEIIKSLVPYAVTNYALNVQASLLWNAFYSRDLVVFLDRNHKRWEVGITNLSISVDPLTRNKLIFSVQLREMKFYSTLSNVLDNEWAQGFLTGTTSWSALGFNATIPGLIK